MRKVEVCTYASPYFIRLVVALFEAVYQKNEFRRVFPAGVRPAST